MVMILSGCSANGPAGPAATSPSTTVTSSPEASPTTTPGSATPTPEATTGPTRTTPAPAGGTPASAQRVVLVRSGGFAGREETVTVEPDGSWTVEGAGSRRTGRIAGADLDRLRQLLADPRLSTEADAPATPTNCADAFEYRLTVGQRTTGYVDCPGEDGSARVTAAVVELLVRVTGS
ncbi:hypothetical protein [Micromonospora siamensis]|uniref:hypothetical protein n=1 Tax=Micromonospora siamensis TaxID=299152 RepID=UPI0012FD1916|nr:hypothetical protein [Micromonospora siamensis]